MFGYGLLNTYFQFYEYDFFAIFAFSAANYLPHASRFAKMDINELLKRIRLGEDSSLELKQVVLRGENKIIEPHPDGLSDELAALANAAGGLLILGVDDKTREITGIPLEHLGRVESWLTSLVHDRIEPPLDIHTRHLELPDRSGHPRPIIVVTVPRSLWVHQSANGYFRRVGDTKRKLTTDALARLFQQRSQARLIRFEEQIVSEAGFADFDPLLVRRFVKPEQGDPALQLQRLHLIRETDEGLCATVAGVLLLTLEPQRWLRNAEIIAVAHSGAVNDPDDQLDAVEIRGPLDRQILDALHFVRRNMRTPARKPLGRIDYPQYSLPAVFEAIVNAVAHRDYSLYGQRIRLFMFRDRIELYSPGALPNSMTIESMARISVPRNEVIASLFAQYYPVDDPVLGKSQLMDRRGAGVRLILSESETLSGQAPQYQNLSDMELLLTIYAAEPPENG